MTLDEAKKQASKEHGWPEGWEPEQATLEEVLSGLGLCGGYLPEFTPGVYCKTWLYRGCVFCVYLWKEHYKVHYFGLYWGEVHIHKGN